GRLQPRAHGDPRRAPRGGDGRIGQDPAKPWRRAGDDSRHGPIAARSRAEKQEKRMSLIIDCHGHYTVLPKGHDAWREEQKAAYKAGTTPPRYPEIADDEIRQTIE